MAINPLPRLLSLDDFEAAARRMLPRSVYGFAAGGAESGATTRANRIAFDDWAFVPRVLVDISPRQIECSLFGRRYAAPFGIAPMGGACMFRRDADMLLARTAEQANIPFVLSGVSSVALEKIGQVAPSSWFQAYFPTGRQLITPLLDRIASAGYDTLVITVDIPVPANRENNLRNGWSLPLRLTPKILADALTHPRWLLETGLPSYFLSTPHFENVDVRRGEPLLGKSRIGTARSTQLNWTDFEMIRDLWAGKLVIKGILSPDDAAKARGAGADAIIVSNHGGRQLDHAVATLHVLPEIVAAAGRMPVLLDGGIRRGTDVVKALILGAAFVFVGRPFLFAAALAGAAGIARAINLLSDEIDRDLGLLGCRHLEQLHPELLRPAGPSQR